MKHRDLLRLCLIGACSAGLAGQTKASTGDPVTTNGSLAVGDKLAHAQVLDFCWNGSKCPTLCRRSLVAH